MKEWYLLTPKTRPNSLGGYEGESFDNYRNDAFEEVLSTSISSTVQLFNYDLSVSQIVRCVIQGRTGNTQLSSMERLGLFRVGTVKAGMYVYYQDCYWLVTGYPDNNGIYEKATLQLCQYKLRWQNNRGKIVERWCTATSASKYDTGESGNATMTLTSDNLTLQLPGDNEVLDLDMKRVFIDKRKNQPTKVYKITRTDGVLYEYGTHGSVVAFIASKTEFNPEVDNQELRICDYVNSPHQKKEAIPEYKKLRAFIEGDDELEIGYYNSYPTKYKAVFLNDNHNPVDYKTVNYKWVVTSDFNILKNISENEIELSVNDESLIGSSFLLSLYVDDEPKYEKRVHIREAF